MVLAVSVAICTFNRVGSLLKTLESVTKQEVPTALHWELLLVDNNSTDSTQVLARSYSSRLPLRYVFEPKQGLSHARNRAIGEFRSELLLFIDDDVRLDRKWLMAYVNAADFCQDAAFFGGRILPDWPVKPPRWLVDPRLPLISGLLGNYDLGPTSRRLKPDDLTPFGASFGIRRRMAEKVGTFRTDLGVVGDRPGRGEEAEYFERASRNGFQGFYVSEAICFHAQDPARFRPTYLYRHGVAKGRAEIAMGREAKGSRSRQIEFALKGAWQLAKGRGDRFRQCVINIGIQRGLMQERRRLLK